MADERFGFSDGVSACIRFNAPAFFSDRRGESIPLLLRLPHGDAYLPVVVESSLNDDCPGVRPFLPDCLAREVERIGCEVSVEHPFVGGKEGGGAVVVSRLLDPELAVRENPPFERRFLHHDEFMVNFEERLALDPSGSR